MFQAIHDMRITYSKQCFISFVGPQNAGMSTLLNKLFDKDAQMGEEIHTEEPTRCRVGEEVFAVDFPGSDSLQNHKERFADFGMLSNFFVHVQPYNGNPSEALVENVKLAYGIQRLAGSSSKVLFCLNKAANSQRFEFDDQFKSSFVEQIKNHIKEKKGDKNEEEIENLLTDPSSDKTTKKFLLLHFTKIKKENERMKNHILNTISPHDFIFTDWMTDPSKLLPRKIHGPGEVKRRINKYLAEEGNILQLENNVWEEIKSEA